MSASFVCVPTCNRGSPLGRQTFSPSAQFRPRQFYKKIRPINAYQIESKNLSAIRKEESSFREQDAVIIVDHGSRRHESNYMLFAFVDMYKKKTGHPIVEPAHMEPKYRIMSASLVCVPTCSRGPPLGGQTFSPSTQFRARQFYVKIRPIYAYEMESKNLSAIRKEESGFREQDSVIIVDHGCRCHESNSMLFAFVDMYKKKTGHPIVEPAHMEIAKPTIKEAFDSCVNQGAERLIISPYFLSPGRHWKQDIPALAAEAAKEHPGIPYIVTAPLGLHELMVNVVEDRIKYCLSQVAGDSSECEMCSGSGKCQQRSA